jgi:hypothetical protein
MKSMIEVMKIPLGSYKDLLSVQERIAIYYSKLEKSLLLSYGQHDSGVDSRANAQICEMGPRRVGQRKRFGGQSFHSPQLCG